MSKESREKKFIAELCVELGNLEHLLQMLERDYSEVMDPIKVRVTAAHVKNRLSDLSDRGREFTKNDHRFSSPFAAHDVAGSVPFVSERSQVANRQMKLTSHDTNKTLVLRNPLRQAS